MRAITVSRQYGSGGGEIARMVAEKLGWRLVDHEVVVGVAHELGVSQEEIEAQDERTESLITRLLSGMSLAYPNEGTELAATPEARATLYQQALRRVVEAAAEEGNVVIVGRASQIVLGGWRDVLHARIVAPLDLRVTYVSKREGLSAQQARDRINRKDQDRIKSLQARYRRNPDEASLYDLTVNTGMLALADAVDLICDALERKRRRINLPESELGPGAGMPRYVGQPGDMPAMSQGVPLPEK
jgi:cytidylate kinase